MPDGHNVERCRVLIVEDDLAIQELVGAVLEHEGFDFVTAENGPDARRRIAREKFDVAVVDVKLPGGEDGLSLADHLWASGEIGVLLVSGDHQLEPKLRVCGHAFLLKPFRLPQLLATVDAVMKASSARCTLERRAPSPWV